MSLMSTFVWFLFKRCRGWQLYSVRLWGWLQGHNERPYPDFLWLWWTFNSLFGREEYNNCCVMGEPPPPPHHHWGRGMLVQNIQSGLCPYLLGNLTWKRTLKLFILTLGKSNQFLHLTAKGCHSSEFFLLLIFCFKQGYNQRMNKTWQFFRALQSCSIVFYVQYFPAMVTLLTALGLCFCLLLFSWQRCTHPDFPVHT